MPSPLIQELLKYRANPGNVWANLGNIREVLGLFFVFVFCFLFFVFFACKKESQALILLDRVYPHNYTICYCRALGQSKLCNLHEFFFKEKQLCISHLY